MAERKCPACHIAVENNVSPSGYCRQCGHDLVATARPAGWQQGRVNLRAVARAQRTLLWFVLAIAVLNVLSIVLATQAVLYPVASAGSTVIMLGVQIAAIFMVVRLLSALDVHVGMRVLYAILMLVPCLGVLALLSVNDQATKALKFAGLKVGLLGVTDEQVVRVLSPNHCHACGYNLVGNTSGKCPECGAPAPLEPGGV